MRDIRGRRRNSSRMISCQRSSTSFTLVKKRWPPRSKRYPSRTAVLAIPPTWSSASSTTTGRPFLASRYPAVSPAGPAPRITVGFSRISGRAIVAGLSLLLGIPLLSGLLVEHSAHPDAGGAVVDGRHGTKLLE